jgi:hypothetical protein
MVEKEHVSSFVYHVIKCSQALQHKAKMNLSDNKVNLCRLGTPINQNFTLIDTGMLVHKHRFMRHQTRGALKVKYCVIDALGDALLHIRNVQFCTLILCVLPNHICTKGHHQQTLQLEYERIAF